jgi:hypothetical protein
MKLANQSQNICMHGSAGRHHGDGRPNGRGAHAHQHCQLDAWCGCSTLMSTAKKVATDPEQPNAALRSIRCRRVKVGSRVDRIGGTIGVPGGRVESIECHRPLGVGRPIAVCQSDPSAQAICESCNTLGAPVAPAQTRTTQAVAKRYFLDTAKDELHSTSALLKENKTLDQDYSQESRSRCADAARALSEAVKLLELKQLCYPRCHGILIQKTLTINSLDICYVAEQTPYHRYRCQSPNLLVF